MMSSICSMPTLSLIVSGRTPAAICSSRDIWRWVVEAGLAGKRLRIADVHQALDEPEGVIEPLSALVTAHDAEGQQRAGAAAEVLIRERMIRAVGEPDIIDPGDAGMPAQILSDAAAVLDVTLDAQRHRLDALEQQKRAHRGEHRSRGALIDAAAAGHVGSRPEPIDIDEAMIRGVGRGEHRKPVGVLPPREIAATIAPPSVVPCPPMNLVSECTTTSAP
jgi:hypothetical protein